MNMKRITFLGDIMIEPPVLKAAKRSGGRYDFTDVFRYVRPILEESDYVIGNFETPLAGKEAKYTQHHYAFNAPDEYADAVKAAGIKLVSTANNHTFDRGYEGMVRTMQVLEEKGIGYAGTCLPGRERPEAFYFELDGTKIAVVVYTYNTNYGGSGGKYLAEGQWKGTVNLLRPQTIGTYLPGVMHAKDWVDKLFRKMPSERRGWIKKFLGMCHTYARSDDRVDVEAMEPYIQQMQSDLRKAREKADLVLFFPHIGGQFNLKPGYFSRYVIHKAKEACPDAIIASHSHCPQLARFEDGIPVVNSLGNFNMSPLSSLAYHENLSEYGMLLHLYVQEQKIQKVTWTPILNYEKRGTTVSAYPVYDYYQTLKKEKDKVKLEADMKKLYGIVTGRVLTGEVFRKEYDLL